MSEQSQRGVSDGAGVLFMQEIRLPLSDPADRASHRTATAHVSGSDSGRVAHSLLYCVAASLSDPRNKEALMDIHKRPYWHWMNTIYFNIRIRTEF